MNEKLSNEKLSIRKCEKLSLYFGIEQGSQEWLELRDGRITCSNAKTLLYRGKNACLDANRRAVGRLKPNGNMYAERGHVVEYEAKNAFNNIIGEKGLKILDCTFVTNDDYPMAGYSPDGLVVDMNDDDPCSFIPLEVKAYNDYVERGDERVFVGKHIKAVEDFKNVPLDAVYQMQMEMLILNAPMVFLLLANPDCEDESKRVKLYEVKRDEVVISRLHELLHG